MTEAEHKHELILLQILYIFVVPVCLMYFKIIGAQWRVILLMLDCLIIYGIIRHERWSLKELGLNSPEHNWFLPYALFVCVGVFLISEIAESINYTFAHNWWTNTRFLFLFIPVSILQEFAFRGFLRPLLVRAKTKKVWIVIITTLLFALIHIIYPPLAIALPVAIVGGFAFALIYEKYPNLYLASAAHIVLNFTAVLYGFFVIK